MPQVMAKPIKAARLRARLLKARRIGADGDGPTEIPLILLTDDDGALLTDDDGALLTFA